MSTPEGIVADDSNTGQQVESLDYYTFLQKIRNEEVSKKKKTEIIFIIERQPK